MSQAGLKPKSQPPNKAYRIQVYNVPESWIEYLSREADRLGISVSDYVKVYILEPWFKEVLGDAEGD